MAVPNFRVTTYGNLNGGGEPAARPLGDYGDSHTTGGGGGFPWPFGGGSPTYPTGAAWKNPDGTFSDNEGNTSWDKDGNFIGQSTVDGGVGGGMNPLLKILTTLGSAGVGHLISRNAASGNVPPELRQLLQMMVDRQQAQTPNFQAVTQGLHAMLPTFAKNGGT